MLCLVLLEKHNNRDVNMKSEYMWLYFEEYQYTATCHLCSQPFHRNITYKLSIAIFSTENGQIYTVLC